LEREDVMNSRRFAGALGMLALFMAVCKGSPTDIDPPDPPPGELEVQVDLPLEGATFALGSFIFCTNPRIFPSSEGTTFQMSVVSPSGRITRIICGTPPGSGRFILLINEGQPPLPPLVMDEIGEWRWEISFTDVFGRPVPVKGGGVIRRWNVI
jgi:hypothetical protein